MLKIKISICLMVLGLGACQVPHFRSDDLGWWSPGMSVPSDLTTSDVDDGDRVIEPDAYGGDHTVDLGLSPWDDVPVELGTRFSFANRKDGLTEAGGFNAADVFTVDAVGTLRMYGDGSGPVRPWVEAFGGMVYNDSNFAGVGSEIDIAPMFGAGVGISASVGHGLSLESSVRYARWETDVLGFVTDNDRLSMIIGLAAWF